MSTTAAIDPRAKIRSYCELLRLPNVFTAIADVLMAYLLTHPTVEEPPLLALIVLSTICLYLAGMVLNDVFDFQADLAERPTRPLPSGRISLRAATAVGYTLLMAGFALGWGAAAVGHTPRTGIVATLLALAVWLYDRILKRTPLGPLAMGSCRLLNVLLGMSPGALPWLKTDWVVAAGMGLYITGVTWFARREAGHSRRWQLLLATIVMGCGMALLCWFPWWSTPLERALGRFQYVGIIGNNWFVLWAILGLSVGFRCQQAIVRPVKSLVQMAVKHALVSLIVMDAALCFAAQGQIVALAIAALVVPTLLIGRWIYST